MAGRVENYLKAISFILAFTVVSSFSQTVANFDFTTLDGTTYNLYDDLLNQKKPVLFHTMTSS